MPIDSEWVIFIVDTSGSMQQLNWRRAERKLEEVLNIYPKLKGIQVMDDEGGYMFSEYRGKWIPDSPARRKVILNLFRGWQAFSNSSPSEGIIARSGHSGPAIIRSVFTCSAMNSPGRRSRKLWTR